VTANVADADSATPAAAGRGGAAAAEPVAGAIWTRAAEDSPPRLFASCEEVREIGGGLLARTLPKPRWTHEAHLAATLWRIRERPDSAPERDLPGIIRAYNEAWGGVNDDARGYHHTVTILYARALAGFAATRSADEPLSACVTAALTAPIGRRAFPLTHYSPERLFSVEARRGWVEPDRAPLSDPPTSSRT
jgi:hypothetical protein